jgi:hypothetical protein
MFVSKPSTARQLLAAAVLASAATAAQSADTIAANYTRISAGETIVAPFTSPSTSTLGSYGGPVELLVSGMGYSLGSVLNDAFYFDGGGFTSGYYMLNIGWDMANLVPLVSGRTAPNFISFIEDVGAVPYGTRPAYAADHVYHFVIDTPLAASALQFGVSDGNFGDNGGAYTVQVWQLQAGAVPEPASWALMLMGAALTATAGARRLRA